MPRPDVVMAKSIYDDNELLPKALVISEPDLKESLIDPDMDRSNNSVHEDSYDDCCDCCDDFCDCNGCCDDDALLLCCCICCICDN